MSEDYQSNNIDELKSLILKLNKKIDQQGERIEGLERGNMPTQAEEVKTEIGVAKKRPVLEPCKIL